MTVAASLPLAAASAQPSLAELAEQCVKCGLCLPHCPTYRVMGAEGESPRGRIAYASALDLRVVEPTPILRAQLDDCLACGTCEIVCPTKVRYDDLIVGTRAAIGATRDETFRTRIARRSAQWRWLWRLLQRLPLGLPKPARVSSASRAGANSTVTLFRGCVASSLDSDTQAAAVKVLAAIGFDVIVPDEPHCCGALDRHAGDVGRADQLAARARSVVARGDVVLTSATGCHRDIAAHVDSRAIDVLALIARHTLPPLKARRVKVAWLAPCTQPHAAPADVVRTLVARIPGVEWTSLPLQPRCCGAAGVYFVDHRHIAEPLRQEKLDQIAAIKPDVVLTTNIGCRLYLQRKLDIPVMHPIQLIADALP